ncbi:hypothetical protein DQ04_05021020 [Trypanosoma grayi]|uniref:hypothetical protein n=1 Tax=Trypanosoma grayi TaxID=71804 RepID=UPI0004F4A6DB|nr:hypothetical protein DQ04_05021020 [Trypanosoma grayi]KEG09563.1 hypothetical protein DQ04_05021020 [Trypanosoma grayi]
MRACEAENEHRVLLQAQRDEIEQLQRRCNELLHERSMMKAATAEDIRQFCLDYQRKQLQHQRQQQQQQIQQQAIAPVGCRPSASPSTSSIPVSEVLQFLHQYSAGMVPISENSVRKRLRETAGGGRAANTPQQRSLLRCVMARQRLRLREDDAEEFLQQQQQQQQQQPQCAGGAR